MATHSSVLAWRILEMGEPGGLPSMGSHRVGHKWSDLAAAAAAGIIDILKTLHNLMSLDTLHKPILLSVISCFIYSCIIFLIVLSIHILLCNSLFLQDDYFEFPCHFIDLYFFKLLEILFFWSCHVFVILYVPCNFTLMSIHLKEQPHLPVFNELVLTERDLRQLVCL